MRLQLLIIGFISFANLSCMAQNNLLPQDSSWLRRFHTEIISTELQKPTLDSIYSHYTFEMYAVDQQIKNVQQSEQSEESINTEVTALNEKRKNLKELRELDLTARLTDAQRKIYFEKIKPAKPSVLHFGMNHDRANCGVCK